MPKQGAYYLKGEWKTEGRKDWQKDEMPKTMANKTLHKVLSRKLNPAQQPRHNILFKVKRKI